jgi:uncharacterized delta-60 repeat protein
MILRWLRRRGNTWRPKRPGARARPPRFRPRVEGLEDRTLLSAGYLDPTFNNGGLLETQFANAASSFASRVAVQSDGKIVVAGRAFVSFDPPGPMSEPVLARFNPDGSFDVTFGQGGQEVIGTPSLSSALDMVLQGDGKIVVAGRLDSSLAVRRFNPDGSPDPTFTSDPNLEPSGTFLDLQDLALQPDGKLLVVTETESPAPAFDQTTVARLDTTGKLDPSFGTGGKVTFRFSQDEFSARGAGVQPDGKVLVGGIGHVVPGQTEEGFAVLRLDAAGQPDPLFGLSGKTTTDIAAGADSAQQVFVQGDGRIVVTGFAQRGNHVAFAAARYTALGVLDPTYGDGGKVLGPETLGVLVRAVLQADDKLVAAVASLAATGPGTALVRYTAAGQLDATFGQDGILFTAFPTSAEEKSLDVADVAVQPDGKLVAAGTVRSVTDRSATGLDVGLARYVPVEDRTPNQRFLAQAYLDLLSRPVDPSGLSFWSGRLDQGVVRTDVVRSIQASDEYLAAVVREAYERLLLREPDPAGLANWTLYLITHHSQDELEASLLGSAEYFAKYGLNNNDLFLNALYHNTVERDIDPSGKAFWSQALAAGASRAAVALAILGSREADTLAVNRYYQRFLHRAADDSGRTAFTDGLQQGVPNNSIIAVLVGSQEYFDRAQ